MKELIKKQYEECRKAYESLEDKTSAAALQLLGAMGAYENLCPELKEDEDEKMLNGLHSWMKEFGGAEQYTEKVYKWIKGLLEKQGEKKYSWTEDEETMLKAIILNLEEVKKHCAIASTQYISKCIDFLKSSLKPLDRWKPTAAQMYSLKEHVTYGGVDDDLRSLYNDLTKLL